MNHSSILLIILPVLVVAACADVPYGPESLPRSDAGADAGAAVKGTRKAGPSGSTSTDPASAPAPTNPQNTPPIDTGVVDAATQRVCAFGNGLYCGGNGVPGATNQLYRCTDDVPALEQTCANDCARMPDGINDQCSCASGDGLYCAGNGVNGTEGTLYRCTGGVAAPEQTCSGGCQKQPDGLNDNCFEVDML